MEEFSKICEVQSDKAAVEISSRYEGTILKLHYKVGDIAKVGAPLVDIETEGEEVESPKVKAPAENTPVAPTAPVVAADPQVDRSQNPTVTSSADIEAALVYAAPAVRRVAREHKVDLRLVKGTGPQGRVLKGDVLAYVSNPAAASSQSLNNAPGNGSFLPFDFIVVPSAKDTVVQLSPIQKAMFKSMTKSLSIPHFGFSDEIYVNATSKFRSEINQYLKALPSNPWPFQKISYMPIFLKALSEALKQYPVLNAQLLNADSTPQLLYRASHNIGIAMDTPQG